MTQNNKHGNEVPKMPSMKHLFKIENLTENMAKCVREDHVQTEELHWRKGGETPKNELKQKQ